MQIKDLTVGGIGKSLFFLSMPIISASFIQMTYNLIDMFWIGHYSAIAVAAIGAAAFYAWMSSGLSLITKVGVEVCVSQSIGRGDRAQAHSYANLGIILAMLFGLLFALILWVFAPEAIAFFGVDDIVRDEGASYLRWISPGFLFTFANQLFSGLYNAIGNSKPPFRINALGLITNIVLDPLFIYGWGIVPEMGLKGAAFATSISQGLVFILFAFRFFSVRSPIAPLSLFTSFINKRAFKLIKTGFPVGAQNLIFCVISMFVAQFAASFGSVGIAAYGVGAQIEAITWMSANGFATALCSFVGQNYGAGQFHRIHRGYIFTLTVAIIMTSIVAISFATAGEFIFGFFVDDPMTAMEGGKYLRINSFAQIFMALEIVSAGAFNGLGRTSLPASVSLTFNSLRIPIAYLLANSFGLGVDGVWWSIAISPVLKGSLLTILYLRYTSKIVKSSLH
ncbi:MAG: MATE family efflux transporter [Bacteroidales bacterium]